MMWLFSFLKNFLHWKHRKNIYIHIMISTPHFNLLRKPASIPSTFGQEKSFLDNVKNTEIQSIITNSTFSRVEEYWLLNRLDNDTQWLLYFAKNEEAEDLYQKLQSEGKITKYYIAHVYGRIRASFWRISTPMAHHAFDDTKMIIVDEETSAKAYRSQIQQVTTYFENLEYDTQTDITTLHIEITKWARHQIRCHLASIGYPVTNDPLYTTKKQRQKRKKQGRYSDSDTLWLMSVWMRYDY